jgi:nucleotide-binding universal stress UspA family protein
MKILIAIDSSAPSELTIEDVAAKPWPKEATICVLNVVESGLLGEPFCSLGGEGASLIEMATDAATTLVKKAAEQLSSHGITTSTAVVQGHPRLEIVRYAKDWAADMVILGSHGRSGLTRLS